MNPLLTTQSNLPGWVRPGVTITLICIASSLLSFRTVTSQEVDASTVGDHPQSQGSPDTKAAFDLVVQLSDAILDGHDELAAQISRDLLPLESKLFGQQSSRCAWRYRYQSELLLKLDDFDGAILAADQYAQIVHSIFEDPNWELEEADRFCKFVRLLIDLPSEQRLGILNSDRYVQVAYRNDDTLAVQAESEANYQRLIKAVGPQHLYTLAALARVEFSRSLRGQWDGVTERLSGVCERMAALAIVPNEIWIDAKLNIVAHLQAKEQHEEAKRLTIELIGEMQGSNLSESVHFGNAWNALALSLQSLADHEQAILALEQANHWKQRSRETSRWSYHVVLDNLVECHLGKCIQAIKCIDLVGARKSIDQCHELIEQIQATMQDSAAIRERIRTVNFWSHTLERLSSSEFVADGKLHSWTEGWQAIEDLMYDSEWGSAAEKATRLCEEIETEIGMDNFLAVEIRMLLANCCDTPQRIEHAKHIEPTVLEWLGSEHTYNAWLLMAYADGTEVSDEQRMQYASQATEIYKNACLFHSMDYAMALAKFSDIATNIDRPLSLELLESAAEVLRARGMEVSPQYADVYRSLALLHQSNGEKFTAAKQMEEVVSIAKQIEHFDADTLAVFLNDLANCEDDLGKAQSALAHYSEALEIVESSPTFEQTYNWTIRSNAATCARNLDRYEQAIEFLSPVMDQSPVGESEIKEFFDCGIELAACYRLMSRYEQSLDSLEELAIKTECSRASFVQRDFEKHSSAENLGYIHRALRSRLQEAAVLRDMDRPEDSLAALHAARQIGDSEFATTLNDEELLELKHKSVGTWEELVSLAKNADDLELMEFFQVQYYRLLASDKQTPPWTLLNAQLDLSDTRWVLAMSDEDRQRLNELRRINAERTVSASTPEQVAEQEEYIQQLGQLLGADKREVLDQRLELADAYRVAGDFRKALAHYEPLLKDLIDAVGANHSSVATCEKSLAICYRQLGNTESAKRFFNSAVARAESIYGAESTELADYLHSLALNLLSAHEFNEALAVINRVVSIYENSSDSESFDFANALRTQFAIYEQVGDEQRASDTLARSHKIITSIYGADTAEYAESLAVGAYFLGQYRGSTRQKAREMFEQAFEIYRDLDLCGHPDYADLLNNYGNLLSYDKDYDKALDCYRECLELRQKVWGQLHPRVAQAHSQIGSMALKQGQLQLAKAELELAFEIWTTIYDEQNLELERNSHQRAVVATLLGETSEAWGHAYRAASIQNLAIDQAVLAGSQAGINKLLWDADETSALLVELASSVDAAPDWVDKALQITLSRKGLALDAACLRQSAAREQLQNLEVQQTLSEIQSLQQKLAELAVTNSMTRSEIETESVKVYNQIAFANEQLSRQLNQGTQNLLRDVSPADLQRHLGEGEVLVEYVVRPRLNLDYTEGDRHEAQLLAGDHLYAFVLGPNASTKLIELGEYENISQRIESFRKQIIQTPRQLRFNDEETLTKSLADDSHYLYERLIEPIRSEFDNLKNLIVSPERDLYFVPFAALNVNENRYLIEDTAVSYLTSARDLTRQLNPVGRRTLLLANPDFDRLEASESPAIEATPSPNPPVELFAALQRDGDLRSLRWKSLPGAEREASSVMQLLDGTSYGPVLEYRGDRAAEEVFKQAVMPRIIHLATHGFYFPERKVAAQNSGDDSSARSVNRMGQLSQNQNPLLRSGLVLAGANLSLQQNTSIVGREDGWLTAQEIASMDFSSTELIVLSACETGLGEVEDGEGVQGLRRSFTVAGAHSLLTSLFAVPDEETNQLMVHFYESFIQGTSKAEAIRQAQLSLIRDRRGVHKAAHPFFWSSFILVGDPK